jgi:hypothetical protein
MNKARRARKKARKLLAKVPAERARKPDDRRDVTVTAGAASASGTVEG